MTEPKPQSQGQSHVSAHADREAELRRKRQAEALRQNLMRRKTQARSRHDETVTSANGQSTEPAPTVTPDTAKD